MPICKECAWEADSRRIHGDTTMDFAVKGVQTGHAACKGGTHCACRHETDKGKYLA